MIVTNGTQFATVFQNYSMVGFHGTSSLASNAIETRGFLPNKVLPQHEHCQILQLAQRLSIDTWSYEEWLGMRSVTFAKDPRVAIEHVTTGGRSGGQGLINIDRVLAEIIKRGSPQDGQIASRFQQDIANMRVAPSVVYLVDLSNLGHRLVSDGALYQVYWNPNAPLPVNSEIEPSCLIEKLEL